MHAHFTRALRLGEIARAACLSSHHFHRLHGGLATFPDRPLRDVLQATFGEPVDVVAFAATHTPLIAMRDGVLLVNPGSATLPASGRGTVALLELRDCVAAARIAEV